MAEALNKPKGDAGGKALGGFDPLRLLRESIRAVPFMKYGLAVVGVFAAAAIVQGFRIGEFKFPLVTFACILAAMVVLSIVAAVTRQPNKLIRSVGQILVCVIILLAALGLILLFSAATFGWPPPCARAPFRCPTSHNPQTHHEQPQVWTGTAQGYRHLPYGRLWAAQTKRARARD